MLTSPSPSGVPPEFAAAPAAPGRPPRSAQEQADRARMRTIAVPLTAAAVGVLLSFLRTHLVGEFRPLIDSAEVFLVAPFVLGALMRTRRGAVAAGLAGALIQLGAWAGTSALRGAGLGGAFALWLLAVGAVGGPLLAASGHLARRGAPATRGLGVAAAASVLIAEGAWRDLHLLHAEVIGWLSIAIGAGLAATLLVRRRQARWLIVTLPLAVLGEIALARIGR